MKFQAQLRYRLLPLLMSIASVANAAPGESLPSAVQERDLDLAACQSWTGAATKAASLDDVSGALGLMVPKYPGWAAGIVAKPGEAETFLYRIALTRPIKLGALYIPRNYEARLLKADAPYPGDPKNETHWVQLHAPAQAGGSTFALASETECRALLFRETIGNGRSHLQGVRLYTPRLHNVTPDSQPYAAEEYTPPNTDHPTHPASNLITGQGAWKNAGKDQSGRVPRAPINDLFPCVFLVSWNEPQQLAGLVLNSNFEKFSVEVFDGPADVHPKAGTAAEWRALDVTGGPAIPSEAKQTWRYLSFPPVATRGLRLTAAKTAEGPLAEISALHTLIDLGTRPVPTRSVRESSAPITIKLPLAEAMNVTLGVNTPDGRRIKNLVVREPRAAGEQAIGWDLKDGDGNFVAPGKYPWTAITYPDLRTRYEMTVYPNVSRYAPENSPWLNALNGSGGWMADHSPPVSGCAAGDRVYLGSYVAESGVSLIECDLKGQKLWGHHSFAAWTGPQFLASDGKEVFVGANILDTSNESVWAVDMTTKEVRRPLSLVPTSTRPRGMRGLAVHDGKIYIACQGVESYLTNAASADDVDVAKCVPFYPPARPPRVQYEIVPDRRNDFLRLFRLQGTPPGGATQYTLERLRPLGIEADQQHVVVAFQRPVAIGSLAFPLPQLKGARVVVSVLKGTASYPPDAEREDSWTRLPDQAKQAWDVVPLPPNTETRAVRISFLRGAAGEGDPLAGLLEKPKAKKEGFDGLDKPKTAKRDDMLNFGGSSEGNPEYGLEGMKLLRRRLANVAGDAKISVSSGKVGTDGVWDAERTSPLTEKDPGIYLMQWSQPQSLRGLAIKEIDGELTKIDVLKDTGTQAVELRGDEGWETIAEYRQERRDHHTGFPSANGTARYVDGYVDFGRDVSTRAVRLRVVKQWTDNLPDSRGIRADLGGVKLDATRCRIFGVAALKYLGGEPAIDAAAFQRIEIYDARSGAPVGEVPLALPGQIAVDAKGELLAVSGTSIVRVDLKQGKHAKLIDGLEQPTALALDRQGNIYVYENGSAHKQVRIYDPSGTLLRSIGKPGGFVAGAWDAERLGDVTALAVDAQNQLWVVENQYHPKRITVWSTNGELIREHLGNTSYGGGGVLDRKDKSRLFYGPMEFELDWKTGLSRIKYLNWLGKTPPGEVLHEIDGRSYLVTRAGFAEQQVGVVYRYEQGKARLAAAMGQADMFEPLKETKLWNELGNKPLAQSSFLWSDLNDDAEVQAIEVKLFDAKSRQGLTLFNRDLGIQGGPTRYTVKQFLPSGVPIYEITTNPKLAGIIYRLDGGGYHKVGNQIHEVGLAADGMTRWTYPVDGMGVQPFNTTKPWRRDQITSQFGIVGHESTGAQGPGEFVIIHANTGAWNIWTHDGLLIGPLFRDLRDPQAKPWSMKEHARGSWLEDITSGQEHFRGHFSRNEQDGKYYAIAGHNHISVLEVAGLEQAQRIGGTLDITPADLERAQKWDLNREQVEVYQRAAVVDAYRLRKPPAIDGRLTGWGAADAAISGLDDDYRSTTGAEFRIGYDKESLYLAWRVRGLGPLKNTGEQWERLFKTGASVDLQLATSLEATADRQAPEVGDLRLLLTFVGDKPKAVLYRPVVPGTKPENVVRVTSPTGETTFDEIKQLNDVRLVRSGDDKQYTLEAAVPLSALGIKPEPGLRLKLDWGVLVSGPDGNEVMRRIYWSNKATQIVADAPSEARLQPHLWGHVRFQDLRPTAEEQLETLAGDKKAKKNSVDDLLNDIKPGKK
ncbi:MAG: hypothetical protein K8U03_00150 [Planctomycetia bacterium]|nr:hypothetical protein [Planctomycetia bacterium]